MQVGNSIYGRNFEENLSKTTCVYVDGKVCLTKNGTLYSETLDEVMEEAGNLLLKKAQNEELTHVFIKTITDHVKRLEVAEKAALDSSPLTDRFIKWVESFDSKDAVKRRERNQQTMRYYLQFMPRNYFKDKEFRKDKLMAEFMAEFNDKTPTSDREKFCKQAQEKIKTFSHTRIYKELNELLNKKTFQSLNKIKEVFWASRTLYSRSNSCDIYNGFKNEIIHKEIKEFLLRDVNDAKISSIDAYIGCAVAFKAVFAVHFDKFAHARGQQVVPHVDYSDDRERGLCDSFSYSL